MSDAKKKRRRTAPYGLRYMPGLQEMRLDEEFVTGWVYYLAIGYTVVYVGSTKDIGRRIDEHLRDPRQPKSFDRVFHREVPLADMRRIEREEINRLRPSLNLDVRGATRLGQLADERAAARAARRGSCSQNQQRTE